MMPHISRCLDNLRQKYITKNLYSYLQNPTTAPRLLLQKNFDPAYLRVFRDTLYVHDRRNQNLNKLVNIPLNDSYILRTVYRDNTLPELANYGVIGFTEEAEPLISFPDRPYIFNIPDFDITRPTWFLTEGGAMGGHVFDGTVLYGCSRGSHTVFALETSAESFTYRLIAGGKTPPGQIDGPLERAAFSYPREIVISDDAKTIFVQDRAVAVVGEGQYGPVVIRKIVLVE